MKRFIEGEARTQVTLLPECLDDYVAEKNPVRVDLQQDRWVVGRTTRCSRIDALKTKCAQVEFIDENTPATISTIRRLDNCGSFHTAWVGSGQGFEAESLTVVADRGYYKGLEILACEQAGITTFVPKPLTSGSKAEGRFGKQDFIYLAARVGDTCGCGAAITTGFPSIQVNGRPMAHLVSPTSHGGTIITGSGDVGGGFVMGDAGGATIINFMALGAFRPDGTVDDEKMATLLADPKLTEKATAANALVDPKAAAKRPDAKPEPGAEPAVCNHPDEMEGLANYIADEMNRNIQSPEVLRMQRLNNYDPTAATVNVHYSKAGQDELRYIWNVNDRIYKGGMLPGGGAVDNGVLFPDDEFFMEFSWWRKKEGRNHCISIAPKWPNTDIYLGADGNIDMRKDSGTDAGRLKECQWDRAKP